MKKTLGKSTTEVIKTLAYQYDRRKDQLSDLKYMDKAELMLLTNNAFKPLERQTEFSSNEMAKNTYNIDLDSFNDTFDFFRRKHLIISSDNNNSPLFPGMLNLKFRAWHDYLHFTNSFPFDFCGEFLTWEEHCKGVDNETVKEILFSEVVLQACYFLVFGEFPKVQKVVLLEDEYIDMATELVYFNSPKN